MSFRQKLIVKFLAMLTSPFLISKTSIAVLSGLVLMPLAASANVETADYPNRSITLVVPYPPGGEVDAMARLLAAKLSAAFKQQVIVENRGGAGGIIGTRAVAHAEPDGYTLLLGHTGTMSIIPSLYVHAGYDPRTDFAPVGPIAAMPLALIANSSFPANSVADIVAFAKKEPGKLNLGTSSNTGYMCGEFFKTTAGINVTIIRHNGTSTLLNSIVGDHIPLALSVLPPALGNVRAGSLRVLAVTSARRLSILPNVPTFDEAGLAGFEAVQHYGLLAPADTPKKIIAKLSDKLHRVLDDTEVQTRIHLDGGEPLTATALEYAAYIEEELRKWSILARKLHLKVD